MREGPQRSLSDTNTAAAIVLLTADGRLGTKTRRAAGVKVVAASRAATSSRR